MEYKHSSAKYHHPPSFYHPIHPSVFKVGQTSLLESTKLYEEQKSKVMQLQVNNLLKAANPNPLRPVNSVAPRDGSEPPAEIVVRGWGVRYHHKSPRPIAIRCPHCKQHIVTRMKHQSGLLSNLPADVLFVLGCCCCIWHEDVQHCCPICDTFLEGYKQVLDKSTN